MKDDKKKRTADKQRVLFLCFVCLVAMGLQSCGSSSGTSDDESDEGAMIDNQSIPFVMPVDAQSLRTALTTGATLGDDNRFWLCSNTANELALAYNLYADGAGVEIDVNDRELDNSFTWQTTSATSMTTSPESAEAIEFTNIQFLNSDEMSLDVEELFSISCEQRELEPETTDTAVDQNAMVGENFVSYGGVAYPLTHGYEDRFANQPLESHEESVIRLANAMFVRQEIATFVGTRNFVFYRPFGSTARLYVRLFSPSTDTQGEGVNSGTFLYSPLTNDELDAIPSPLIPDGFFFTDASFRADLNNDGRIDSEDGEVIKAIGGTISLTRTTDNRSVVNLNLTLDNGVSLVGTVDALFLVL